MMPPDEMVALLFWSHMVAQKSRYHLHVGCASLLQKAHPGSIWTRRPRSIGVGARNGSAASYLKVGILCVMFLTRVAGPTGNAFLSWIRAATPQAVVCAFLRQTSQHVCDRVSCERV